MQPPPLNSLICIWFLDHIDKRHKRFSSINSFLSTFNLIFRCCFFSTRPTGCPWSSNVLFIGPAPTRGRFLLSLVFAASSGSSVSAAHLLSVNLFYHAWVFRSPSVNIGTNSGWASEWNAVSARVDWNQWLEKRSLAVVVTAAESANLCFLFSFWFEATSVHLWALSSVSRTIVVNKLSRCVWAEIRLIFI